MPPVVPLPPGEPAQLGPYHLIGRLTPAVHMARSPSGEQVVIKRFRRVDDPRKVAALRQVAAIGTALILDTGPDYVVSERVDGPSLDETEPLSGPALHRLAIALMTTVAALHRAGISHGRIRPDQVVTGPDGPRLLCHGSLADAPAWRSPEELRGEPAAGPTDLFAWAATVTFAATGRIPFATDEKRLVHGATDLGPLDGDLRELVADCLASQPRERPTADEALLRLIGHSGALNTLAPSMPAPTRPRSRRPSGLVLTAAGLAIALVSGGAAYALTPRPVARVDSATELGQASPSTAPTASTSTGSTAPTAPGPDGTTAPPPTSSPPQPTKEITLPTGGTLYEHPDDPVLLTSYQVPNGKETVSYARAPGEKAKFEQTGGNHIVAAVSPGGRWLVTINEFYFVESSRQVISFTDRTTGSRFSVPALGTPYYTQSPTWSRDGNRVLLTVFDRSGGTASVHVKGFLIIDVGTRQTRFVQTANEEDIKAFLAKPADSRPAGFFRWTPDGAGVSALYITPEGRVGVRFWDLSGRVTRSMHWVGPTIGFTDPFSPSGKLFTTTGCVKNSATCVRDTATGARQATVPAPPGAFLLNWYDESHLVVGYWSGKNQYRAVVVDLQGKEVRLLAEVKAPKGSQVLLSYTRR